MKPLPVAGYRENKCRLTSLETGNRYPVTVSLLQVSGCMLQGIQRFKIPETCNL